ncbi:hypothetical protein ACF08M_23205 [Streptomyces sp. NPDC015032]
MTNQTDAYVLEYQNTNCTGPVIEAIPPGGRSSGVTAYLGRAVYIN